MNSPTSWKIVSAQGGFAVMDGGTKIASITTDGRRWRVSWVNLGGLDFVWGNSHRAALDNSALSTCIGYVRGVERCAQRPEVLR